MPIKQVEYSNKITEALLVCTPHKGVVTIDCDETIRGLFSVAKGKKEYSKIISQIAQLQQESEIYLRDDWLKEFYQK